MVRNRLRFPAQKIHDPLQNHPAPLTWSRRHIKAIVQRTFGNNVIQKVVVILRSEVTKDLAVVFSVGRNGKGGILRLRLRMTGDDGRHGYDLHFLSWRRTST